MNSKSVCHPRSWCMSSIVPLHCHCFYTSCLIFSYQLGGWNTTPSCLFPRMHKLVNNLRLGPFHPVSSFLRFLMLPLPHMLSFPPDTTGYVFTWLWFAISLFHWPDTGKVLLPLFAWMLLVLLMFYQVTLLLLLIKGTLFLICFSFKKKQILTMVHNVIVN